MRQLKIGFARLRGYRTYAVAAFGFILNALYGAGLLTDEGLHPQNWTLAFLALAFLRAAVTQAVGDSGGVCPSCKRALKEANHAEGD